MIQANASSTTHFRRYSFFYDYGSPFYRFYSTLCGFCRRNDRNDNDNNESLKDALLTKIEGKKS